MVQFTETIQTVSNPVDPKFSLKLQKSEPLVKLSRGANQKKRFTAQVPRKNRTCGNTDTGRKEIAADYRLNEKILS